MPYQLDWIVEKRLLFGQMWDKPSPDEIRQFSASINRSVASGQPPVHCLIDINQVTPTPFSVQQLDSFLSRESTENFGWIILVSDNLLSRFLGAAVIQLALVSMRVFKDRPSALRFLSDIDSTLPDLTAVDFDRLTAP